MMGVLAVRNITKRAAGNFVNTVQKIKGDVVFHRKTLVLQNGKVHKENRLVGGKRTLLSTCKGKKKSFLSYHQGVKGILEREIQTGTLLRMLSWG